MCPRGRDIKRAESAESAEAWRSLIGVEGNAESSSPEHIVGYVAVLHLELDLEALSRAIARHATGLVDHVANRGDLASLGELIPWGGDSGVTVTVIMGLEIP